MADTAIENALARRAKLEHEIRSKESEINNMKQELKRIDGFISDWQEFADPLDRAAVQSVKNVPDTSADSGAKNSVTKRKRPKNPRREFVAEKVDSIIRERGAPIPRAELFEMLTQRGVEIHGKNPEMVLSTMLWRSGDKIVRIPQFGYWVADLPYEKAGYDPSEVGKSDAGDSDGESEDQREGYDPLLGPPTPD